MIQNRFVNERDPFADILELTTCSLPAASVARESEPGYWWNDLQGNPAGGSDSKIRVGAGDCQGNGERRPSLCQSVCGEFKVVELRFYGACYINISAIHYLDRKVEPRRQASTRHPLARPRCQGAGTTTKRPMGPTQGCEKGIWGSVWVLMNICSEPGLWRGRDNLWPHPMMLPCPRTACPDPIQRPVAD